MLTIFGFLHVCHNNFCTFVARKSSPLGKPFLNVNKRGKYLITKSLNKYDNN